MLRVVTVLFSLGFSSVALAQGVGAVAGTVTDASGGVMPGVTLTLLSPGLIGSGQAALSDGKVDLVQVDHSGSAVIVNPQGQLIGMFRPPFSAAKARR